MRWLDKEMERRREERTQRRLGCEIFVDGQTHEDLGSEGSSGRTGSLKGGTAFGGFTPPPQCSSFGTERCSR